MQFKYIFWAIRSRAVTIIINKLYSPIQNGRDNAFAEGTFRGITHITHRTRLLLCSSWPFWCVLEEALSPNQSLRQPMGLSSHGPRGTPHGVCFLNVAGTPARENVCPPLWSGPQSPATLCSLSRVWINAAPRSYIAAGSSAKKRGPCRLLLSQLTVWAGCSLTWDAFKVKSIFQWLDTKQKPNCISVAWLFARQQQPRCPPRHFSNPCKNLVQSVWLITGRNQPPPQGRLELCLVSKSVFPPQ